MSVFGVSKFLKHYKEMGTIARKPGSGRLSKVTSRVKELVEEQMQMDDETTATQLHTLLVSKGINISLKTILRCRKSLGWTFRGSAYCQLIREANKSKRLQWALLNEADDFNDVIWTDESSIQLENHRRFCCRKQGQPPKPKPRYVLYINNYLLCCVYMYIITMYAGQNTQSRCTFGLGLVGEAEQPYVFLKVSWIAICSLTFCAKHLYHSFGKCIQISIGSCRIMILSIHLTMQPILLPATELIGGKHLPSPRTLIL